MGVGVRRSIPHIDSGPVGRRDPTLAATNRIVYTHEHPQTHYVHDDNKKVDGIETYEGQKASIKVRANALFGRDLVPRRILDDLGSISKY